MAFSPKRRQARPNPFSSENHTLLIQLTDGQAALADTVGRHIAAQEVENQRLHERITTTARDLTNAVTAIKDSNAARGRISGQFILTMLAVLLSSLVAVAGFVQWYVSSQVDKVMPSVAHAVGDMAALRADHHALDARAQQINVDSKVREAELAKDLEWMKKLFTRQ